MTDVIFSFDTEDFENETDDAVLFWTKLLEKYGLKGCFCVVGEKARAFLDRGRHDVVEALSNHEIDYHSNYHSMHPTHAELLEDTGWFDGVDKILLQEAGGILDVEGILGERPTAYCKPGASWGPQVIHAMKLMGLPVFCDAPFEYSLGIPLWYCGQLLIRYHISFDAFFDSQSPFKEMKERFDSLIDRVGDGCAVIYTHPCRLLTTRFTDNFRWGKNAPRQRWETAPMRDEEKINSLKAFAESFVRHVSSRKDISIITYKDLLRQYREKPRWIGREILEELAERSRHEVDFQVLGSQSFSPAQIFAAVAESLSTFSQKGSVAESLPVREILGPLEDPPSSKAFVASEADLMKAAASSFEEIELNHALPSYVRVGQKITGPGACLQALSEMLGYVLRGDVPPDELSVPKESAPKILSQPIFSNLKFRDSWSIFPPSFEGENVLRMARLQAWTARPAIRRKG